ncbi:MAG TPA: EAL domain-containing protein [Burkholderiales bacterium]|nr:EAL domain-containing protein [Burkholderiales bacterium]
MTQAVLPKPKRRISLLRCMSKLARRIAALRAPLPDSAEHERLELLRRCSLEGLWDWDLESDQVRYFPRFRELLGYSAKDPFSRLNLAFHPEDTVRMKAAIRRLFAERASFEEEFRLRCKNGSYRWFRGRCQVVRDRRGCPMRVAGSVTDISVYKENEQRLLHLADHDTLTGLPNRRIFLERLARGIERAAGASGTLAVLFVDLDRFKRINDVFGHEAGNVVLHEAARRIGGSVREDDTVSRLGGDEFTVLLEGVETTAGVCTVADRIRAELRRPFPVAESEVYISASIGIALFPRDGTSAEELLKRSDVAMYQAKKNGRDNQQFYSQESETRISRGLDMEARLRRALDQGEIEVHYQPQVGFADGEIRSVEALARWNNPELGWVPPAQFIPLAEETGLIHPIGAWVLETAAAQAKAWHAAGLRPMRMCINVSARQLNDKLVKTVSRVLAQTGIDPACLELEITETVMVSKDPGTDAALLALRALGIGFAIDDFGTGYATFDYLKRLPVRTLKVDGSFIRNVCESPDDAAIVAASVSLARSLSLRVVAEGVETAEQHALLGKLGCDDCQGYFSSRPLPAQAMGRLLASKYLGFPTDRPRLTVAR